MNKEIIETIKMLADECKNAGENNLAIVLYTYLGAVKSGMDKDFAEYCQKYSVKNAKRIDELIQIIENRNN